MIKLIVFNLDKILINGNYTVKVGVAIKTLLENNIQVGIISKHKLNKTEENMLYHLHIKLCSINNEDKLEIVKKWCYDLNINLNEVAFLGCPNDKDIEKYVLKYNENKCVADFCYSIIDFNNNINVNNDNDFIEQIKKEVNYQLDNFNIDELQLFSDFLIEKNLTGNIYFTGIGKSENIAIHFCNLLKSIGLNCFYLNWINGLHGDIGTLKENDLIIIFSKSGNTIEIINSIEYIKNKKCFIYGICCGKKSMFNELCDKVLVTPFCKEINNVIDFIPTNSYMSHLLFVNLIVSFVCYKLNIQLETYKLNHPGGNIGNNLKKIKDILITNYPEIVLSNVINLHDVLLMMTDYKIGCCFFIDVNDKLVGIMTDGDIRRLLLNEENRINIHIENINQNYYYETDVDKFIFECKKICYIPILDNNKKMIGFIENK